MFICGFRLRMLLLLNSSLPAVSRSAGEGWQCCDPMGNSKRRASLSSCVRCLEVADGRVECTLTYRAGVFRGSDESEGSEKPIGIFKAMQG